MPTTEPDQLDRPANAHPSYGPRGILLRHWGPDVAEFAEDWQTPRGKFILKGYQTDGASSPRWAYILVDPFGVAGPASYNHDDNYDPIPDPDGIKQRTVTRREADRRWRQDFIRDLDLYYNRKTRVGKAVQRGLNRARAGVGWAAIRLGGWKPWNAGTKNGTRNVEFH